MEVHPHRLQAGVVAGLLAQIPREQACGPVGAGHPHRVRIELDHPPQLGLPGCRHRRWAAGAAALGDARHAFRLITMQHPLHGGGVAPHQRGDLGDSVALAGAQPHLGVQPRLGVAGRLEARLQFCTVQLGQTELQGSRHDGPPARHGQSGGPTYQLSSSPATTP
jgi:hypothetical protein